MKFDEVLKELKKFGNENTKKIMLKHGAKEPLFGVKVQDLKKIVKKIKVDHDLALQLYDTGNSDAMYLAGLLADENKITKAQLNKWAQNAEWSMISEYTVAGLAAESKFGFELGLTWIESKKENIASCGWATLGMVASIKEDSDLDLDKYKQLLNFIENNIHNSQNRVRYTMNGFVITVGSMVKKINKSAEKTAKAIGKVSVSMGDTACKVPLAKEYIKKVKDMDKLGKKKKAARC